jgi:hypothetical protein
VKKTQMLRDQARKLGIYLCHEIHPGTGASTADDFNMLVGHLRRRQDARGERGPEPLLGRRPWETRFLKVRQPYLRGAC